MQQQDKELDGLRATLTKERQNMAEEMQTTVVTRVCHRWEGYGDNKTKGMSIGRVLTTESIYVSWQFNSHRRRGVSQTVNILLTWESSAHQFL